MTKEELDALFEVVVPNSTDVTHWQTHDGRKIPLVDMELPHLQNAVRMVSTQELPQCGRAAQEKVLLALTAELDRRIAIGTPETKIAAALARSRKK